MRRYYPGRMAGADLREMMSSSPMFAQSLGPRTARDRYVEEDVPYGLVPIAAIARTLGLHTPCTDAVVTLASVASGQDFARSGRTLERLGLAGLHRGALLARVADGN
jgi:opine dehydrogenase